MPSFARYWYLYMGWFSSLLPVAGALLARRRLTAAHTLLLAFCLSYFVTDSVSFYFGPVRHMNNHWVSYVMTPVEAGLVLWALSLMQVRPLARIAIRNSAPLIVLALLGLSIFEDFSNFSRYTEPVLAMVVLIVSLYTLGTRSLETTESLVRQDWFWISGSLALLYGSIAALTPFAAAFTQRPDLIARAYLVAVFIRLVSMIGITYGVLCPIAPQSSGISSLRASSASPSS